MSVFGKIYARRIHDGVIGIKDVPVKYRSATRQAYYELFGEQCPEV